MTELFVDDQRDELRAVTPEERAPSLGDRMAALPARG